MMRRRGITGSSCEAPRLVLVGGSSSSASGLVGRSSASVLVGGSSESGLVGVTVSGDSTPERHNNIIIHQLRAQDTGPQLE